MKLRTRSFKFLSKTLAVACFTGVFAASSHAQPRKATTGSIKIVTALVASDLTVKPIPLHQLEIISLADTTSRQLARTGLDGSTSSDLPIGRYQVRSLAPITAGDSSYRWDVQIELSKAGTTLELTNANAGISFVPRVASRLVAPEREVFESVKRGVFRVEAGLGHGTGFLIGSTVPLVVTNDHVVGDATTASVYIDSVTRVPAEVLIRDREADLALLRIPAARCATCPRLRLAVAQSGEPVAVAGERVLAIGFPLNQEQTLTTGIVSGVREGAIISDVNMNPGNSGGPMLNLAGEVIGVNAFGERTQVGSGIAGAIAIHKLKSLLEKATVPLIGVADVPDRPLQAMPQVTYPLPLLKAFADTATTQAYARVLRQTAGMFHVTLTTPTLYMVQVKASEREVGGDRRKREAKAGVAADEQYSELKQTRDWEQYVGSPLAPVIGVQIEPQIGETFWSAFGRTMQAASYGVALSAANMKFKGDLRGARFYRNGEEIEPLRGGHAPQAVRIDNQWIQLKDVADMGYYVLAPEAFRPDSSGAPPVVTIVVQDLKNPKWLSRVDFNGQTSARIWNDFGPYFQHIGQPWIAANPKLKSPKVNLQCDPEKAVCSMKPGR